MYCLLFLSNLSLGHTSSICGYFFLQEFFENPAFRPDGLKLYPTLVIRGTGKFCLKYLSCHPRILCEIFSQVHLLAQNIAFLRCCGLLTSLISCIISRKHLFTIKFESYCYMHLYFPSGLYELWKTGRYKSYPPNTLVDLVARILALVPPWTRVYRVQR